MGGLISTLRFHGCKRGRNAASGYLGLGVVLLLGKILPALRLGPGYVVGDRHWDQSDPLVRTTQVIDNS